MNKICLFLVFVSFFSCEKENSLLFYEEQSLKYFCSQLLNKDIFPKRGEQDEQGYFIIPPGNLSEDYYKDGFLKGKKIFLIDRVSELSMPTNPSVFKEIDSGEELKSLFNKDYDSKSGKETVELELLCQDMTSIRYASDIKFAKSEFVYLKIKHHLSAGDYKLVDIELHFENAYIEFQFLLNKEGDVLFWF